MNRRCLWAANSYWNTPFRVGANHYARRLAQRGWDVTFVSEPVSPLHLLRKAGRAEAIDRLRDWYQGGGRDVEGKLFHYSPLTLLPHANLPLLRSRFTLNHWQSLSAPNLKHKIKREGFGEVDLLVIDAVRQGWMLDAIPHRQSIFRVTDRLDSFPSSSAAMIEAERELIRRVDCVVYTAITLEEYIKSDKPQAALYLPNGADVDHFSIPKDRLPCPVEYETINQPIAVYVGAIASWFDVELLANCAAKLPDVSFVVIGPVDTNVDPLRRLKNLHLLGRRPYDSLPGYLKHASVGIIPFRRGRLVDGVSPIKMYEYLACGLPVVSTRWAELEAIDPPAALCDDAEAFSNAICTAIETPGDISRRIAYAQQADWGSRLDALLNKLGLS